MKYKALVVLFLLMLIFHGCSKKTEAPVAPGKEESKYALALKEVEKLYGDLKTYENKQNNYLQQRKIPDINANCSDARAIESRAKKLVEDLNAIKPQVPKPSQNFPLPTDSAQGGGATGEVKINKKLIREFGTWMQLSFAANSLHRASSYGVMGCQCAEIESSSCGFVLINSRFDLELGNVENKISQIKTFLDKPDSGQE